MSNKTHSGEVDEQVVMRETVEIHVSYDVLRVDRCDGEHTHYYWRIDGASDHDTSDCFPSAVMAMLDAEQTIKATALEAVTESPA